MPVVGLGRDRHARGMGHGIRPHEQRPFGIKTGDGPAAVRGALQKRRELKTGTPTIGFECTFSVPDVDRLAADVVECGGRLLMEKTVIAGVGYLVFFEDPEGNVVGAMTYDPSAD